MTRKGEQGEKVEGRAHLTLHVTREALEDHHHLLVARWRGGRWSGGQERWSIHVQVMMRACMVVGEEEEEEG